MTACVRWEREGDLATVTLDRPEALNALDDAMLAGLEEAFQALAREPAVRVVILTGAGKAFAAGADIRAMADFTPDQARAFARRGQEVFRRIETFPRPVLAAVNGYALGGGCELALACDLRIASEGARIGQPEVKLGVPPGFGGTQRLPRLIGRSSAKLLLFTGEPVTAARALELGLVDEVAAPERLLERCREIAASIARRAPLAVAACKAAVNAGMDAPLEAGLAREVELFAEAFASSDQKAGMRAFLDRRDDVPFQGI